MPGGIGLGVAVDYLQKIGMDRIRRHEEALTSRIIGGLAGMQGVRVYAPEDPARRVGVISFTVEGFHPHEVAQRLDDMADIMVRSGHHCCMPLMQRLGLPEGTARVSIGPYNTADEADLFLAAVGDMTR